MMTELIVKNCRNIFIRPWLYLAILIFTTCFFGYFYVTLPTETSVESLVIDNDPDLAFYETFKEQFGEDEFLVVGFSAPDVFSQDILRYIKEQTNKIEALKEVEEVISLTNAEDFIGSENSFIVRPLIEQIPTTDRAREIVRKQAMDNLLIKGNLVSKESTAALFFIRPQSSLPSDTTYDARLIKKVRQIFDEPSPEFANIDYHMAGWLVTDVSLSTYMERDLARLMPLTYCLLIILVWFFLRNRWAVFLTMLNVTVALIWTLAILNLIGGAMNPITSILPPLIMALVVSDSIHFFVDFFKRDRSKEKLTEIILCTIKILALPCFLTSLTTAIGFASLGISDIPPIRHFGLAAALGMMAEFILSMTIIPLGIYFLRNKVSLQQAPKRSRNYLQKYLSNLAELISNHQTIVLFFVVVIVLGSGFAATRLSIETNLLEYFKKSSPVYTDAQFIDNRLGGVNTLEISFKAKDANAILNPKNLAIIDQVAKYLEEQGITSGTTSINDFLKEMNRAFHNDQDTYLILPESRKMAAQFMLLYDGDNTANFIDENYQWATLSARVTEHNSKTIGIYIKKIQAYLAAHFNEEETGLNIRITGKTLLANKLVKGIFNSQVQSLALAFTLIFCILFFVFRSLSLGFIAIIPNALPILFNLGLMGFAGIPLNTATAIISAVAIGIAVDDTIHFIYQYQKERTQGKLVKEAIQQTIEIKGMPIITTSLILMGGFGILVFGSFVPTITFGFLSALIMLFALISDLVVLPAILLAFTDQTQQ